MFVIHVGAWVGAGVAWGVLRGLGLAGRYNLTWPPWERGLRAHARPPAPTTIAA